MVKVNPINVINLVLATFQTLNLPESPVIYKEIELAEKFVSILKDSMKEFHDVEIMVLDSLEFQEPYKDIEAQIIEDEILHTIPNFPKPPTDQCTHDDDDEVTYDYKVKAV